MYHSHSKNVKFLPAKSLLVIPHTSHRIKNSNKNNFIRILRVLLKEGKEKKKENKVKNPRVVLKEP